MNAIYSIYRYGTYEYGDGGSTVDSDIDINIPDLISYLPWYYQKNDTMTKLQGILARCIGMTAYHIEDLDKQLFISTATWRLAHYEKLLGLQTNISLTYEERREIAKARLIGVGTTTKAMIKQTAEAFSGGEVDVIEYPGEYHFVVQFIGVKGIPRNMQGFIEMLESIKPAHLSYEFEYTYTVWNFINLTWDEASAKTWDELRIYEGE